jgi:acetyl esterase/lipase
MSLWRFHALVRRPGLDVALGILSIATIGAAVPQRGPDAATKDTIESNVVYGVHADVPLPMDVHRPEPANGRGIVFIPGAGWAGISQAGGQAIKDNNPQVRLLLPPLLAAGYTVFVVEHRGAPRFHYPSQLQDVERAVRFIRHNASRFGIEPGRIGGVGYSSGANLVAMLGVRSDKSPSADSDPIERESERIQCVVGGGTPADLTQASVPDAYRMLSAYLGEPVGEPGTREPKVEQLLKEASPITYVTRDDAPMLLFNGTNDRLVPISNMRLIADALQHAGVPVKAIPLEGAPHWPLQVPGTPDLLRDAMAWLDQCMARATSSARP